ncbi:hypothetical protein LTS10_007873 [Elasticomyces elasticus]|nr:hypothetical protein LTS10_007873 [Elasticomyces elasticus]
MGDIGYVLHTNGSNGAPWKAAEKFQCTDASSAELEVLPSDHHLPSLHYIAHQRIMEDWAELRDVLNGADLATANMIIRLRIEDMIAPPPAPLPALVTCVACSHDYDANQTVHAACDHDYCAGCLEQLYNACMTDESLFPPRCCRQAFTWELVRNLLSRQLQEDFVVKRIELETQDRTYCHIPTCSAFINPAHYVQKTGLCPKGCISTCTECKRRDHVGVCRDDPPEELLATARAAGWQTCFGCHRMVELIVGCNHMTYVNDVLEQLQEPN